MACAGFTVIWAAMVLARCRRLCSCVPASIVNDHLLQMVSEQALRAEVPILRVEAVGSRTSAPRRTYHISGYFVGDRPGLGDRSRSRKYIAPGAFVQVSAITEAMMRSLMPRSRADNFVFLALEPMALPPRRRPLEHVAVAAQDHVSG